MILDNEIYSRTEDAYKRPLNSGKMSEFKELYGSEDGWIAQNIRFIASQWNIRPITMWRSDKVPNTYLPTPADEIIRNYRYYLGNQDDRPYAYLAEWSEGNDIPAPFTKGDEIYTVVQHMLGQMSKLMSASRSTIESLDQSVMTEKEQFVQGVLVKKKMPEIFKQLQEMGVDYMPEGRFGGKMDADVDAMMRRPIHAIERYGLDIIRHIENTNNMRRLSPTLFKDALIGRHCAAHVQIRSGRIFFEHILPFYLIKDVSLADDMARYSPYKGHIFKATPEEICHRFELSDEEVTIIRDMVNNKESQYIDGIGDLPFNMAGGRFSWFDNDISYEKNRVTCVYGDWVVSIKKSDGSYRNTRYGGYLIGGKILVEHGECDNVVFDKADPSFPLSKIVSFSPDTTLGENRSPVDRFRKIQDDMDAYLLQVRKTVSRDLGRNYVFMGEKLGEVKNSREIVEDFKNHGITVINGATGEEGVPTGSNRLVEVVDMSLDQNVVRYLELYREREEKMKSIVSMSNITMGMQQTYIGGGTQRATIDQASNGTTMYFHGFMQFYVDLLELGLATAKTSLLDVDNDEEASIVFDGAAREFWKAMNDVDITDLQVRVDIEDVVDDVMRQKFDQIGFALAQNYEKTGFSMLDYAKLQKLRTLSEIEQYFEEKLQKIEDEKKQQELRMMMMQAVEQEKARQHQTAMQEQKDKESLKREVVRQNPKMQQVDLERQYAEQEAMGAQPNQPII